MVPWIKATGILGMLPDTGFLFWLWWYSLINSGMVGGDPGPTDGAESGDMTDATLVVDPVAATMVVSGDVLTPSVNAKVIVRLSRPLPPGRTPNIKDCRVIAAIAVGTAVDVAAAYEARFGRLPVVGSKVLAILRYGDPTARSASAPVNVVASVEEPVSALELAVSNTGGDIEGFGTGAVTFELTDPDGTGVEIWEVTMDSADFGFTSTPNLTAGVASEHDMNDSTGDERTELVTFEATETFGTGRTVSGSATFTVLGFGP